MQVLSISLSLGTAAGERVLSVQLCTAPASPPPPWPPPGRQVQSGA